jgi:prepilin-type N-terminal cleavage/methylation domain-containing protein
MKNNLEKNRKKGFSLVEVMLAVFILVVALVVFIQVIAKSIDHSSESRDTIIASGLAQEGVELVKNIRDNNFLGGNGNIFAELGATENCAIDYDKDSCSGSDTKLYFADGLYNINGGTETKFSRQIVIEGEGTTRTITSMIIWEKTDFPLTSSDCTTANKCVYAEIVLTDWGLSDEPE